MQLTPTIGRLGARGRPGARTRLVVPVLLGLLAAGGLVSAGASRVLAAEAGSPRARLAQQLFARTCSQCHGGDGGGGPGRAGGPGGFAMSEIPDFTNRSWQQSRSKIQLIIS